MTQMVADVTDVFSSSIHRKVPSHRTDISGFCRLRRGV